VVSVGGRLCRSIICEIWFDLCRFGYLGSIRGVWGEGCQNGQWEIRVRLRKLDEHMLARFDDLGIQGDPQAGVNGHRGTSTGTGCLVCLPTCNGLGTIDRVGLSLNIEP